MTATMPAPISERAIVAERATVVLEAFSWLRTPYIHEHSLKGHGVDCAQLLIAVYTAAGVVPRLVPEYYSRDWFLHQSAERFLAVVLEHCVPTDTPRPGDIALFRFGRAAAHGAIVTDFPRVIHADRMVGSVLEDACGPTDALGARLAGVYTLKRWARED